ncbi:MAG: hypothetical protein ACLQOO_37175 [Terriglobia bacterium]
MHRLKLTSWSLVSAMLVVAGLTCNPKAGAQAAKPESESPATPASSPKNDEVKALKDQLALQQKQIDQLQKALEEQKQLLQTIQMNQSGTTTQAASTTSQSTTGGQASASPNLGGNLGQVASLTPVIPATPKAGAAPAPHVVVSSYPPSGGAEGEKSSPLSVGIGDFEFTPGGFMDFTTVYRTTDVGSGIGTSFGGIPYSGSAAGSLSETRLSMQNSRISLAVTGKTAGFDLKGYVEADFLGFAPPNVYVSSNANTLRSRLYWLQARKGSFEFLGGQSWTMMTPNRTGLSPNPSDVFYSQDMDTNYQVGLTWARQAQFRLIYHASDTVTAGISIEDPQQLTATGTVPSALAGQGDNGSGSITNSNAANNPATPNLAPDIIAKVAFDPNVGGRHEHIEIAGLLTSAQVYDPTAHVKNKTEGGGASINFNLEVAKNFHAILDTFYSDGGGRYIYGLGPQFVIDKNSLGVYQPSMVHSGSGIAGFEYQATKQTMFYGYYGGAYYKRDYGIDSISSSGAITWDGFGYPGAANSQNKSLQEGTFGVIQTFWKSPRFGALQLITQYSYLDRNPWVVASKAPKDAHLSMGYVDLRYVLP